MRRPGSASWWRVPGPGAGCGGTWCRCVCAGPRQLAGLRELPKFYIVMVLAEMHRQLREVGAELVEERTIDAAGDVFFLDFDELRVGLRGADLKGIVARRRRLYDVELRRRRVPRLCSRTAPTSRPP